MALTALYVPCLLDSGTGNAEKNEKVRIHLTECIHRLSLESQLPHKIIDL